MTRQGDQTAFLTGVSALIPAPSAEIADPTLELGRPPSQRASGYPERREGQAKIDTESSLEAAKGIGRNRE